MTNQNVIIQSTNTLVGRMHSPPCRKKIQCPLLMKGEKILRNGERIIQETDLFLEKLDRLMARLENGDEKLKEEIRRFFDSE